MSEIQKLSSYVSDDGNRKAVVSVVLGTNNYIVQLTSDTGSVYSANFNSEDSAEQYAENYVL
jgi:hypothetical protein